MVINFLLTENVLTLNYTFGRVLNNFRSENIAKELRLGALHLRNEMIYIFVSLQMFSVNIYEYTMSD